MKLQKICFLQGRGRVNIHGFDLPSFLRAVVGGMVAGWATEHESKQLFHERTLDMK